MKIRNNQLSVLLMPTDQCNMNCIYCFNADRSNHSKMSLETLRRFYEITLPNLKYVTIIWHGGEPLIMGLDFYREAVAMQKEYTTCTVANHIQTNLTLLNEEWIDFFVANSFKVGSSFDGTLNDKTRGNSDKILSNAELLSKANIRYGFISVISNVNVDTMISDYEFFKSKGLNYTTNLYVASKEDIENPLCLNEKYAIEKFSELYDYWLHDKESKMHMRFFEIFIDYFLWGEKKVCMCASCLGNWAGIKNDGEIVPCNRYFPKEFSYGNVFDYTNIEEAFDSEGFRNLLGQAIERRNKCKDCIAYGLCAGGCNNVAYNQGGICNNNGNHCKIFKAMYSYIQKSINDLLMYKKFEEVNIVVKTKLEKYVRMNE